MKIYFIASLYGKEKYGENYKKVVDTLEDMGHTVKSDHVLGNDIDDLLEQSDESRIEYYKKMLKWIGDSDAVVAEITSPSSSIGHEITLSLEKEKPVIGLSYKGTAPSIFKGLPSDRFQLIEYDGFGSDFERELRKALKKAQKSIDIRFNFFISPKISNYLDWVSKKRRIPRSVYLRRLIEDDMKENPEFSSGDK